MHPQIKTNMQRLILILLCTLPLFISADEYVTFYPEEIHGPVKQVKEEKIISISPNNGLPSAVQHIEILFYDSLGREYKDQEFIDETLVNERRVQFFGNDSSILTIYNQNGEPNGSATIRHYDSQGRVCCYIYLNNNKLWHRDSIVYNEWGKIDKTYYSFQDQPYVVNQEYSYDSNGEITKMRDYWGDGSLHMGFDTKRIGKMLILHRFGMSFMNSPMNHWDVRIYYNDDNHVVRVVNEARHEEFKFSDFDEYGNWTRSECTATGGPIPSSVTSARDIEYWGQEDKQPGAIEKRKVELSSILKISGFIIFLFLIVPFVAVLFIIAYDRNTANPTSRKTAMLH